MRLSPRPSVHHVCAGPLERLAPPDVALLVEARLDLHQTHHRLARLCRPDQSRNDQGVAARSVDRLLDGDHVGIVRGPVDELGDARSKVVERVVHQQVAFTDDGEHVGVLTGAQTGVDTRLPRRAGQPGGSTVDDVPQGGEVHERRYAHHAVEGRPQMRAQDAHRVAIGRRLDLQADHVAEPPRAHLCLHGAEQIVRLVRDVEVGIPCDAKQHAGGDVHAGEHAAQFARDELFYGDEATVHRDEPGQSRCHFDPGETSTPVTGIRDGGGDVERQRRDVRKGLARPRGERGEDGDDLARERRLQTAAHPIVLSVQGHDAEPFFAQGGVDLTAPQASLFGHERTRAGRDLTQDRLTIDAIGTAGGPPGFEGIQVTRDANHEELVQIAGEDRHELAPLDDRQRAVGGQGEHALVEIKPRKVAVDVQLGPIERCRDVRCASGGCQHCDSPTATGLRGPLRPTQWCQCGDDRPWSTRSGRAVGLRNRRR